MNPDETKLKSLLREARISPALPPRFQENVWRRIEDSEAAIQPVRGLTWLDAIAALVLRPRFALATALVLVAAGALLGAYQGNSAASHAEQTQYLSAVVPAVLR